MRTLGKWLAIAVGIYLAIAVVMNAVEPARREKEARAAQAAANLEQRQAEKAAKEATGKAKRLEECAGFPDERQTIYDTSPRIQCLLHGAQYARGQSRLRPVGPEFDYPGARQFGSPKLFMFRSVAIGLNNI
jgi:hypothetical protein